MRVAVFSTRSYERPFFDVANAAAGHELTYLDAGLTATTADLAHGYPAVSIFVGDDAAAPVLRAAGGCWRCDRRASTTWMSRRPTGWV